MKPMTQEQFNKLIGDHQNWLAGDSAGQQLRIDGHIYQEIIIKDTHFNNLDLGKSYINNVLFVNCKFNLVDFGGGHLSSVKFIRSELRDCSFCGAEVHGLSFRNSTCDHVSFAHLSFYGLSWFDNTVCRWCGFEDFCAPRFIKDSSFYNCSFHSANWDYFTSRYDALFQDCNFTCAKMSNSCFGGMQFFKCLFNNANLSRSIIGPSEWRYSDITNANFQMASFKYPVIVSGIIGASAAIFDEDLPLNKNPFLKKELR